MLPLACIIHSMYYVCACSVEEVLICNVISGAYLMLFPRCPETPLGSQTQHYLSMT